MAKDLKEIKCKAEDIEQFKTDYLNGDFDDNEMLFIFNRVKAPAILASLLLFINDNMPDTYVGVIVDANKNYYVRENYTDVKKPIHTVDELVYAVASFGIDINQWSVCDHTEYPNIYRFKSNN